MAAWKMVGFDVTPSTPSRDERLEVAVAHERAREEVDPHALAVVGQLPAGGWEPCAPPFGSRVVAGLPQNAYPDAPEAESAAVSAAAPGQLAQPGGHGELVPPGLAALGRAGLAGGHAVGAGLRHAGARGRRPGRRTGRSDRCGRPGAMGGEAAASCGPAGQDAIAPADTYTGGTARDKNQLVHWTPCRSELDRQADVESAGRAVAGQRPMTACVTGMPKRASASASPSSSR